MIIPDFDRIEVPESDPIQVDTIEVEGAQQLPVGTIDSIIEEYEGKALTLRQMQEVADRITDAYRQNGYITTRAILPPQQVQGGTLTINVIEGFMGDLTIQGNQYYADRTIRRRVTLKEGEIFNYDELRENLSVLNQYTDRQVRSVLVPGEEDGTTDVVLEVQDQLPIHVGVTWDNFGSRYIEKERYQLSVTHNNLLGFDDILTLRGQSSQRNHYRLGSIRYLFPFNNDTQVGIFAARTDIELGREFRDVLARGKSEVISLFVNHKVINGDQLTVELTGAFDYKDVINFLNTVESSRDRLRIASAGVNVDYEDDIGGRYIFNNRLDVGIPDILGGLESGVDSRSSRPTRAGGEFVKWVSDILRLQPMPWGNSTLLLKGQLQFASRSLVGAEQIQIGGITNVRGYPTGELVGDNGQTFTAEWSWPLGFIPRNATVPFTQNARWYDSLRVAGFYDFGRASLDNPLAGQAKDESLESVGLGVRFNLPGEFFARVDFSWPMEETPSDGKHMHTLFQVTKEF